MHKFAEQADTSDKSRLQEVFYHSISGTFNNSIFYNARDLKNISI